MKQIFQTGAAKIAAGIQDVGSNFDFEVFSLPGGSVLALVLWIYSGALASVKRAAGQKRPLDSPRPRGSDPTPLCERTALPRDLTCAGCGCS